MEMNLVAESMKIAAAGMMAVMLFLWAAVWAIRLQAAAVACIFPEQRTDTPDIVSSGISVHPEQCENARTAAIIAAVMEFRKEHAHKG
jgi:Na+-transporting methylmalonyl-CoA/oxaloacetate decarboxylase gamma subunit